MIITHVIEVTGFIVGLISAYSILRKDSKYLANIFLAIANILISMYLICIFIYDIINELWAINVFLRIGMISLLFANLCIYYSMVVMMKSSKLFKQTKLVYINFLICLAIAIFFIATDFIHLKDSYVGNVNVQIDLLPLALLLVNLFYLTIMSIVITFKYGIRHIPKGEKGYSQIRTFAIGLFLFILTLFVNIISQITSNDMLGVIFDVLTFTILLIGMLFLSFSVLDFKSFLSSLSSLKNLFVRH